jgi:hypothetical protein
MTNGEIVHRDAIRPGLRHQEGHVRRNFPLAPVLMTMTRTLSTPVGGGPECEPAFDELGAEVGIVFDAWLAHAVTASRKPPGRWQHRDLASEHSLSYSLGVGVNGTSKTIDEGQCFTPSCSRPISWSRLASSQKGDGLREGCEGRGSRTGPTYQPSADR